MVLEYIWNHEAKESCTRFKIQRNKYKKPTINKWINWLSLNFTTYLKSSIKKIKIKYSSYLLNFVCDTSATEANELRISPQVDPVEHDRQGGA